MVTADGNQYVGERKKRQRVIHHQQKAKSESQGVQLAARKKTSTLRTGGQEEVRNRSRTSS